ncbi:hypothetical protein RRG08_003600 [Elysia crispata]|uniref:Uncharacterized protein n=1 Tax=Elysia crispata TaxID=231223 RepID=A0AAE1DGZ7_9GAST|nr:hypothetical protein RRG08_003600 [Elysia crispata]
MPQTNSIKVERVEIKDVRLSTQLQRAMAAEAEAARDARAKIDVEGLSLWKLWGGGGTERRGGGDLIVECGETERRERDLIVECGETETRGGTLIVEF